MTETFRPGDVLLPYQQRWISDRSKLKIAEKTRRCGITWATSLEGVLEAAASPSAGGQDVWYSVTNEDDARIFVEDCADWCQALGVAASDLGETMIEDEDADILAFRIRFSSGFKITGLSSNPRRLRGKEGYVIADEAAHNEHLSEFMKAAKAFVMWGRGRVSLISTHNGSDSHFNDLCESVRAGQLAGSIHRITIHDALNQGLYRRICQKSRVAWSENSERAWLEDLLRFYGEDSDEELLCVPRGSGGRYFVRQSIEQCQHDGPVIRLTLDDAFSTMTESERRDRVLMWCENEISHHLGLIPIWAHVYFGEDFGRVSDLTVLAPMYIDASMVRVVPFLIELRNVPFEEQKQILFYVMDHYRDRIAGGMFDAGGNGAATAEAAKVRYGRKMRPIHLAGGPPREHGKQVEAASIRYSEILPPMKANFEDRQIRIPRHRDIVVDLEMFERKDGFPYLPHKRARGTDHGYRHGDSGVALALAHYASLELAPPGPTSLRRVRRPSRTGRVSSGAF